MNNTGRVNNNVNYFKEVSKLPNADQIRSWESVKSTFEKIGINEIEEQVKDYCNKSYSLKYTKEWNKFIIKEIVLFGAGASFSILVAPYAIGALLGTVTVSLGSLALVAIISGVAVCTAVRLLTDWNIKPIEFKYNKNYFSIKTTVVKNPITCWTSDPGKKIFDRINTNNDNGQFIKSLAKYTFQKVGDPSEKGIVDRYIQFANKKLEKLRLIEKMIEKMTEFNIRNNLPSDINRLICNNLVELENCKK